jgi:alkanesulfonate monooxygenase
LPLTSRRTSSAIQGEVVGNEFFPTFIKV